MLDRPAFRTGYIILLVFTLLAGDAWRYTVSWYGFGVIAVALTVVSVALILRHRPSLKSLPMPLLAFLALATLSLAWSFYPGSSALGLLTTWMTVTCGVAAAVAFNWDEILNALGVALRLILGLSIVFELFVSLIVRQPILPFWVDYPEGKLPLMLMWSRNLLFDGGPIQGVVGNSSLLAFAALLALIVFGLQLAKQNKLSGWAWMLVAVGIIALTRSATIYAALAALGFVLLALWLVRRARRPAFVYSGIVAIVVAGVVGVLVFGQKLLPLVGKSEDLTGRTEIWAKVVDLAVQRPFAGWGWVSYWTPWAEPFQGYIVRNGVVQLHAHNAWLDVWLQLGILGLVVFGALVLVALVRSWMLAVRRDQRNVALLLPLLLMVALLVQSLAESRLLVEYGLFLLVVVAVRTKRDRADAATRDSPAAPPIPSAVR